MSYNGRHRLHYHCEHCITVTIMRTIGVHRQRLNANGSIAEEWTEDDEGQKHGTCTTYHDNGVVESQCEYEHGWVHGLFRGFYRTGQLRTEHRFEYYELHGEACEWHENGQRRSQSFYHNGQRIGIWSMWHANGVKANETDWNARPVIVRGWNSHGEEYIVGERLAPLE